MSLELVLFPISLRIFLKNNKIDPDKDVMLRAIGATPLRAAALEKGIIAAAPFSPKMLSISSRRDFL